MDLPPLRFPRRNTAKKFVAAANFLELLRIFDNDKGAVDLAPIEEKIKYAKWKAADIAKALREAASARNLSEIAGK